MSATRGDFSSAGLSLLTAVPLIGDVAAASKIIRHGIKISKTAERGGVRVGKANKKFVNKGNESPFGSDLIKVKLTEDKSFVRVATSDNVKGRWMMEKKK